MKILLFCCFFEKTKKYFNCIIWIFCSWNRFQIFHKLLARSTQLLITKYSLVITRYTHRIYLRGLDRATSTPHSLMTTPQSPPISFWRLWTFFIISFTFWSTSCRKSVDFSGGFDVDLLNVDGAETKDYPWFRDPWTMSGELTHRHLPKLLWKFLLQSFPHLE